VSRAPVERPAGILLTEMEAPTGALNGSALEKPMGDITPVEPPAPAAPPPEPVAAKAEPLTAPVKPVNPLRLARPLEKAAQGLSKTAIPPTRPMPMPTISPLCPPGSAAAKNGIKGPAAPAKNGNGTGPEPAKPVVPISQPLKATTTPTPPPDTKEEAKPEETPKEENPPPPVSESLAADNHAPEKAALDKSEVDKAAPEIPVVEKEAPEKPIIEKPVVEKPAPEKTAPEKPVVEKPAPEKSAPEKPTLEKPVAEKPAPEKQSPEKTAPEKAAPLKPVVDAPSKPVEEPAAASAPVAPAVPQPKVVVPPTNLVQEPTAVKGKPEEANDVGKEDGKEEEEEEVPAPTSLPENQKPPSKPAKPQSPQKAPEGPKVPVAEKTPRQKKRKASQEVAPLPDDEKRLSKRARAPPTIYESPDPEMTQILKTIKKQEEEDKRATSTSDKEDEKPLRQRAKKKAKVNRRQAKKSIAPADDSDSDLDEPPSPKATARSRVKPKSSAKPAPPASQPKKKGDPVFFKDEYMAVRNAEGSFYICKAMQNIFLGSKNIKIQWLSNEDPVVPAKDNPDGDIFAHDFYDKTEFETILTSVELEKTLGRSKRMILPEEELERIKKILQRAVDKAAGKLDLSDLLTEDNPDGLDISLYKGEDQLDEIERKRKGEEKKIEKKSVRREVKQRVEKEVKDEIDFKPEVKKRGRAKEDALAEKVKQAEPRKGRRAASNISYDHDSYDFLEDDDDEVMPAPKKRKSQDSLDTPDEGSKVEGEKVSSAPRVQTEKKKEEKVETQPEELSTSEKAALAEKAKMESEEKEKEEDSANATSEAQQHAKKRGRKPKP